MKTSQEKTFYGYPASAWAEMSHAEKMTVIRADEADYAAKNPFRRLADSVIEKGFDDMEASYD